MKALILLHWRVMRNHLKRRLHYISVYFDWAGTVTYLYLLAFVVIVIGYYLYDPYNRIPFPVLLGLERLAQGILGAVPLLWLLAAFVLSGRTAILLSPADVHHLPQFAFPKSTVFLEQWLWPAAKRIALALLGPLLILPFLTLLRVKFPFGDVLLTQVVWALSGLLGLTLQWLLAFVLSNVRGLILWLKRGITIGTLVLLGIRLLNGGLLDSSQLGGSQLGDIPLILTPNSGAGASNNGMDAHLLTTVSLPWFSWPLWAWIVPAAVLIILVRLTIALYARRPWEPTLRQSQEVHTLRTLIRARDQRELKRYRQARKGPGFIGRLLGRSYVSPAWALSWKGLLTWRSANWTQVFISFLLPLFAIRLFFPSFLGLLQSGSIDWIIDVLIRFELPLTLLILQGYTQFLFSWQDDLQHMELFRLLPIPPKQAILSTLAPPALTIGLIMVLISLIFASPFLAGRELILLAALALAEGILGAVLVAREMLKDPSSTTSALGPERWISAFSLVTAPAVVQLSGFWGVSTFDGLTSGLVVAGGLTVVFFILMVNEFVLLRSRYGV